MKSCLVRGRGGSGPVLYIVSPGERMFGWKDWNVDAIISDFVTFPLGRVPSPLPTPQHVCQLSPVSGVVLPHCSPECCRLIVTRCLCVLEPQKCSLETMTCVMMTFLFFLLVRR